MRTATVEQLREALVGLNRDDYVVIETIDLDTGDTDDLYPMYVDVIDLGNGHTEVRLCQMQQSYFDK